MKKHLFSLLIIAFLAGFAGRAQSQELYLVFLNTNPDREELSPGDASAVQEGHLENIDRLYDEGKLLLAGPFDGGGGVFVLKAKSFVEAESSLETDPAIAAERFTVETLPLGIQKGWICAQEKPYEMIALSFVHFMPNENAEGNIPYTAYLNYARQSDALFAAAIQYDEAGTGYIAVFEDAGKAEDFAKAAPVITEGTHSYKVRSWWATDQTFCPDESKKIN